ncbi:PAS domain S-box protein [Argonema galeatum]|uniref:PAS domain S-box protein n=1 Tax=Argonema galeatum TaxID=2942762 RepID=UPI002011057E|nr:PAS domain S-box protein [Argonema galeatum]MCL1465936.1 PAS domain S-box protein [Argonema galeatum A003/A1]
MIVESAKVDSISRYKWADTDEFFNFSLELLCIVDTDGYFKHLNHRWEKTLGFRREELLAKPLLEFVHPEDREATVAEAEKLSIGVNSISFENRYICKDGSYKWLMWTAAQYTQDGLVYAMAYDITSSKQIEEALHKEREFLNALLNNLADGIVACDANGVLTLFNQATREFHGLPSQPLPPEEWAQHFDLYLPDGKTLMPIEDIPLFRAFRGETVRDAEVVIAPKQGKKRTLLANGQAIVNPQGKKLGAVVAMHDITERLAALRDRKQAQEQLRQTTAELETVFEALPDLYFRLNIDGTIVDYMAGKSHSLYTPPEVFLGKPMQEVLPPQVGQQLQDAIAELLQTRSLVSIEYSLPMAKGECFYEARLSPLLDDQIIVIVRDISDRKRAEKTQAILTAILEATPDFVSTADVQGNVLYINRAGRRMMGLAEDEDISTKKVSEFCAQSAAEIILGEGIPAAIKNGTWMGETALQYGDSREIPVSQVIMSHKGKNKEVEFISTIARDMTDRILSEEALQQSETRFRQLAQREVLLNRLASDIRNSLDVNTILKIAVQEIRSLLQIDRCLFVWYQPNSSVDGGNEGGVWEALEEAKVPSVPSFVGQFSAAANSVTQKLIDLEILRVDDLATATDPGEVELYAVMGFTAILSLPILTRSGKIGVVSCGHHSGSRPWTDEEVELLVAVSDQLAIALFQAELYTQAQNSAQQAQEKAKQVEQTLHELKQTQAQLVQSEKMSSLGQMVAGVAHEINNPVNFIYGNLSHASEYSEDLLNLLRLYQKHYPNPPVEIQDEAEARDLDFMLEDLPKILASMKMGANRIREIILSLRNFSRLDEAEMKAVDIHEGIDSTLLILQNRLKAKPERTPIKIVKEYGDLPPIECYPGQLNQVLMNILNNAIDALETQPAPRTITIHTEIVSSQESAVDGKKQKTTDKVAIRIQDNGPGISESVKSRLFDPFFTTKPVGQGTGLGLSISYQIVVEKHRGVLKCISEPGQGSEFWIEIPITQTKTNES